MRKPSTGSHSGDKVTSHVLCPRKPSRTETGSMIPNTGNAAEKSQKTPSALNSSNWASEETAGAPSKEGFKRERGRVVGSLGVNDGEKEIGGNV